MAGGEGIRMKPFTNILPKPLIPVNEKTVLEHIIDNFLDQSINRFYISIFYQHQLEIKVTIVKSSSGIKAFQRKNI